MHMIRLQHLSVKSDGFVWFATVKDILQLLFQTIHLVEPRHGERNPYVQPGAMSSFPPIVATSWKYPSFQTGNIVFN